MTTNLIRDEARRRSELLEISRYSVILDLGRCTDREQREFDSVTEVDFTAEQAEPTFIDLIAAGVVELALNGERLDPEAAFDGARVRFTPRAGANTLRVHARALYSRTGEGLHRFFDPADDTVYLYTQYEPTDARRVFANFDQPDLKARFSFTVLAPDDLLVRSNAPVVRESPTEPGVTCHEFADTEAMSTYITCVVAGHYAQAQTSYSHPVTGAAIDLGLLTRASLADHMDADEIFRVTAQGLDFFHTAFDIPYPWGKYDQVFVPEYNLGAMENPGLVTFTDALIFRDQVTRSMRESRANVILHEMAHMWFGDLVTMEWWDDLWLKESFADYMAGLALAEATEHTDGWVTFALRRKDWAYRQDQYPTTHPIVADIPDVEAAKLNFDGITYAKGASVLKQLVTFVGREAFLDGSRRYFRAHAFGTATLTDFLTALAEAAPDRDVHHWADAWLRTVGVSEIELTVESGPLPAEAREDRDDHGAGTARTGRAIDDPAGIDVPDHTGDDPDGDGPGGEGAADGADVLTEVHIRQENSDGAADAGVVRPHRLAVAAFDRVGPVLERTGTWMIDFAVESCDVPEMLGTERPALILPNDGDLDYCKVRLDPVSTATALSSVSRLADPLHRALVWSALGNALRDGLLPTEDYFAAYCRALPRETHPGIAAGLRTTVLTALDRWTSPASRPEAVAGVLGAALDSLVAAEPGSDSQLDLANTVLALVARTADSTAGEPGADDPAVGAGREFASALLAGRMREFPGLEVDHALRWKALIALVALGWADTPEIEAEAAADRTGSGALHAATASAARPLPIVKMRAWEAITGDTELSNDMLSATIAGFTAPSALPLTESSVSPYFDLLDTVWTTRSIEIARRLVVGLYPHWSQRPQHVLERTDAWLADRPEAPGALRRLLLELRDDLARSIRIRGV